MLLMIQDAFENVFDIEEEITMETTVDNLDEWDSMRHLELVMELENKLNIKFSMDQITNFDSVDKIVKYIKEQKSKAA